MSQFGGNRINADPKTATQLRAALAAAQEQSDDLTESVADLNAELDVVQAQVGPVEATFVSTSVVGQPVYVSAANQVSLADADSPTTAAVVGLVFTAAGAGQPGEYIPSGRITQADWTAVTGSASLISGSVYYLSGTTGQLTTTAPSTGTVVRCGRALNTETLNVAIEPGVLL